MRFCVGVTDNGWFNFLASDGEWPGFAPGGADIQGTVSEEWRGPKVPPFRQLIQP
jgi:hypothetical protein